MGSPLDPPPPVDVRGLIRQVKITNTVKSWEDQDFGEGVLISMTCTFNKNATALKNY